MNVLTASFLTGVALGAIRYGLPILLGNLKPRKVLSTTPVVIPEYDKRESVVKQNAIARAFPIHELTVNDPANDTLHEPMLASDFNHVQIAANLPLIAQPKIDGMRLIIRNGVAYTRSLERFPNIALQRIVKQNADMWQGVDGEITLGNATDSGVCQRTQSIMGKHNKEPFTIHVFDRWDRPGAAYMDRQRLVYGEHITNVESVLIHTMDELNAYETKVISQGYEGVVLRDPNAAYRNGRAIDCGMVRLKRFTDCECVIISKTRKGVSCKGLNGEYELSVSIADGETLARLAIGCIIKIKHKGFTVAGTPRHATYIGTRDKMDMSTPHEQTKPVDGVLVSDAVSAMHNLGMGKTKAKALVNDVYSRYDAAPSLSVLIKDCVKSLAN